MHAYTWSGLSPTKGCRQCPEDQAICVLEKAHPLHTILLPFLDQAGAMKQSMHITMAVWLALNHIGVILFQSQMGIIVCQAGYLPAPCTCALQLFAEEETDTEKSTQDLTSKSIIVCKVPAESLSQRQTGNSVHQRMGSKDKINFPWLCPCAYIYNCHSISACTGAMCAGSPLSVVHSIINLFLLEQVKLVTLHAKVAVIIKQGLCT